MENARSSYGEIYEDTKLYDTLIYYIGVVGTVAAIIPAPYNQIGVAVLVIIDAAKQVLKDLWKQ